MDVIWKEEDLIDVAVDKKAIQSSLSQWSKFNDASRACDPRYNHLNFAFHTGDSGTPPWWMVDLENEYCIESIKIYNRFNYQERIKTLCVAISNDKENWTFLDKSLFVWDKLDSVIVNASQAQKARYVKIYLQENVHFHLRKVQVFIRKYKGFVFCPRPDGLGMRIITMCVAMYIAKRLNYKFYFNWPNFTDTDHIGANKKEDNKAICGQILFKEQVFTQDFLDKHHVVYAKNYYQSDLAQKSFDEIDESSQRKEGGYFVSIPVFPHENMKGISKEESLQGVAQCYKEIGWSLECLEIISHAQHIAQKLHNNFVAFHLRGGEVVSGTFRIAPLVWMRGRYFPFEIALELCLREINNGNNIVLFGQDFKAIEILKLHCKQYIINKNLFIISVDDLLENKNYDIEQRTFFEVNLMSYALKIYATGSSAFSKAAVAIAGKELIHSFYNIFSTQELYDLILKNINTLPLDKYNKAYAYHMIYLLSKQLSLPLAISLQYVQRALEFDEENDAHRIAIIDCLLRQGKFQQADELLKEICTKRLTQFLEALYGRHTIYRSARTQYTEIYDQYEKHYNQGNYIAFIVAKITLEYYKDKEKAIKFVQNIAFNKIKDENFISLIKNLEIYKEEQKQEIKKEENDRSGALLRTKNYLSYKLGSAMIDSSKSMSGYIKLPFILIKIAKEHKKQEKLYQEKIKNNPKLKLPPLETYTDYKEALKLKEHLSYKLGEAFIKAYNNRWGGAYQICIQRCG